MSDNRVGDNYYIGTLVGLNHTCGAITGIAAALIITFTLHNIVIEPSELMSSIAILALSMASSLRASDLIDKRIRNGDFRCGDLQSKTKKKDELFG